jgi:hypothetical protein
MLKIVNVSDITLTLELNKGRATHYADVGAGRFIEVSHDEISDQITCLSRKTKTRSALVEIRPVVIEINSDVSQDTVIDSSTMNETNLQAVKSSLDEELRLMSKTDLKELAGMIKLVISPEMSKTAIIAELSKHSDEVANHLVANIQLL